MWCGGFHLWGIPIAVWFMMENPTGWFRGTPISGNLHVRTIYSQRPCLSDMSDVLTCKINTIPVSVEFFMVFHWELAAATGQWGHQSAGHGVGCLPEGRRPSAGGQQLDILVQIDVLFHPFPTASPFQPMVSHEIVSFLIRYLDILGGSDNNTLILDFWPSVEPICFGKWGWPALENLRVYKNGMYMDRKMREHVIRWLFIDDYYDYWEWFLECFGRWFSD